MRLLESEVGSGYVTGATERAARFVVVVVGGEDAPVVQLGGNSVAHVGGGRV